MPTELPIRERRRSGFGRRVLFVLIAIPCAPMIALAWIAVRMLQRIFPNDFYW